MQHALGLAGRAGGVEDEERVFSIHRLGRAGGWLARDQVVIPDIAGRIPVHLAASALDDDNLFDAGRVMHGAVDIGLQRRRLAATHTLIGGDDDIAGAIIDPSRQGFGRETAKHDRMDRTDAGAGQHGIGRFRDHRHIDGDPVAFLDAE